MASHCCGGFLCGVHSPEYMIVIGGLAVAPGTCYLYMKTAERMHTPRNLWEKVKLPKDYFQALEKVCLLPVSLSVCGSVSSVWGECDVWMYFPSFLIPCYALDA